MFWTKLKKLVTPDTENEELKAKITQLQKDIKWYETTWEQLNATARSLPIAIDFNKLNVFSVERNINEHGIPMTIIGYMVEVPHKDEFGMTRYVRQVKEWFYHCDDVCHEKLVKEFEEYKINLAKRPF